VWKVLAAAAMSMMASVVCAQAPAPTPTRNASPFALPAGALTGLFELDGGWMQRRVTADAFMQEQQERRLGIMHAQPGVGDGKSNGPNFNFTGNLLGGLQYHWTAGQKPELGFEGVPARLKLQHGGVYVGLRYRQ
jgi:hypothetical protein